VRFRIALNGDRFRWKSGTKPCLYGVSRLSDARRKGQVVLVEGESDCHTLWYYANRPLIRDQALGEALDPDKLERLGRYEVHLDRKLERTLSMLLRLKELRQGPVTGKSVWQNG
jgi:hypothetical protein